MTMLDFSMSSGRFVHRVAGAALDRNRVLLCQLVGEDYWFLPGGRVNFLETTEAALKREMQEELGTPIEVGRLLWVVENFFQEHYGKPHHEIGFYYLMRFPSQSPLPRLAEPFHCREETENMIAEWLPLAKLPTTPLYPAFLRRGLRSLPASTEHVSIREGILAAEPKLG